MSWPRARGERTRHASCLGRGRTRPQPFDREWRALPITGGGQDNMRRYCRYVIMLATCAASASCTGASASDGTSPGGAVTVAAATSARARSSTPVLLSRPAAGTPVPSASAIPTVYPSQTPAFTRVVTVDPATPPDGPKLPLGPGVQAPPAAVGPVTCTAAPSLALNCPPEAPTASTCTSRDNLPRGCQSVTVPGALSPPQASPACCP